MLCDWSIWISHRDINAMPMVSSNLKYFYTFIYHLHIRSFIGDLELMEPLVADVVRHLLDDEYDDGRGHAVQVVRFDNAAA